MHYAYNGEFAFFTYTLGVPELPDSVYISGPDIRISDMLKIMAKYVTKNPKYSYQKLSYFAIF